MRDEKQIPCGDDNKKDEGLSVDNKKCKKACDPQVFAFVCRLSERRRGRGRALPS